MSEWVLYDRVKLLQRPQKNPFGHLTTAVYFYTAGLFFFFFSLCVAVHDPLLEVILHNLQSCISSCIITLQNPVCTKWSWQTTTRYKDKVSTSHLFRKGLWLHTDTEESLTACICTLQTKEQLYFMRKMNVSDAIFFSPFKIILLTLFGNILINFCKDLAPCWNFYCGLNKGIFYPILFSCLSGNHLYVPCSQ